MNSASAYKVTALRGLFLCPNSGGNMKKLLFTLTLFALAFGFSQTVPFTGAESLPDGDYAVFRVIDGDTFTVLQDLPVIAPVGAVSGGAMSGGAMSGGAPTTTQVERSIRVLGIDTPEMHPLQPGAQEATNLARSLLEGQVVTLTALGARVDRYGRALEQVEVNGQNLALELLGAGLAETQIEGNEFYAELYRAAQAGAKSVGKGLWAGSAFKDRNCGDLVTQAEAQVFFDAAATAPKPDPHRLDGNKDSIVCLDLP